MKNTELGFVNRNDQQVIRATGKQGTDYLQCIIITSCGVAAADTSTREPLGRLRAEMSCVPARPHRDSPTEAHPRQSTTQPFTVPGSAEATFILTWTIVLTLPVPHPGRYGLLLEVVVIAAGMAPLDIDVVDLSEMGVPHLPTH